MNQGLGAIRLQNQIQWMQFSIKKKFKKSIEANPAENAAEKSCVPKWRTVRFEEFKFLFMHGCGSYVCRIYTGSTCLSLFFVGSSELYLHYWLSDKVWFIYNTAQPHRVQFCELEYLRNPFKFYFRICSIWKPFRSIICSTRLFQEDKIFRTVFILKLLHTS